MAHFTPSQKTPQDFNNGIEYIDGIGDIEGDAVHAETINNLIESQLWVQGLAVNQPDVSEIDQAGTADVSIVIAPDGTAQLKFSNLKGQPGVGITSIVANGTSEYGGNIYKITLDDGRTYDFTAPKGTKGEDALSYTDTIILSVNNSQYATTAKQSFSRTPKIGEQFWAPNRFSGDAKEKVYYNAFEVRSFNGNSVSVIRKPTQYSELSVRLGNPTATATSLESTESPTADVTMSGTPGEEVFNFEFGIPKGQDGQDGLDGVQGNGYYRANVALTTTSTSVARTSINPTGKKLLSSDTIVDTNGLVFAVTAETEASATNVPIAYRGSIKGTTGDEGLGIWRSSASTTTGTTSINLSTITIPTDRSVKVGDLIIANSTYSYLYRVSAVSSTAATVSYLQSLRGATGASSSLTEYSVNIPTNNQMGEYLHDILPIATENVKGKAYFYAYIYGWGHEACGVFIQTPQFENGITANTPPVPFVKFTTTSNSHSEEITLFFSFYTGNVSARLVNYDYTTYKMETKYIADFSGELDYLGLVYTNDTQLF